LAESGLVSVGATWLVCAGLSKLEGGVEMDGLVLGAALSSAGSVGVDTESESLRMVFKSDVRGEGLSCFFCVCPSGLGSACSRSAS